MPTSYVRVYVHFVWATWDREDSIQAQWEERLRSCIAEECRRSGCGPIQVGGTANHVHALVRMSATVTIAQTAQMMKGGSSHLVNAEFSPPSVFRWQGSYGALSVEPARLNDVAAYVRNQKSHHAASRFVEEWERCTEFEDAGSDTADPGRRGPG